MASFFAGMAPWRTGKKLSHA